MHELQAVHTVHGLSRYSELFEVVENIRFDPLQPRLRCLEVVRLDSEGQVLRLDKTVVALGKLGLQHIRVLGTELIETVALQGDGDALRIGVTCGRRVDKRELEADGAVEVVEEIAPAVKDRGLVLVLIELVVDVLKLYGLGVEALRHAADPVRVHPLEGDAVLRGLFLLILIFCPCNRRCDLLFLGSC